MSRRLTEARVSALQPDPNPRNRREVPDGGARGLYCVVQPSGHRAWAVRYVFNGRKVKYTLGSWPDISLAAARKQAADVHLQIERGVDPAAAKRRSANLARALARLMVDIWGAEAAHAAIDDVARRKRRSAITPPPTRAARRHRRAGTRTMTALVTAGEITAFRARASGTLPDLVPGCGRSANVLTLRSYFPANGTTSANAALADGSLDGVRDHARPLYFGHFCHTCLQDHAAWNVVPASGALPDFTAG